MQVNRPVLLGAAVAACAGDRPGSRGAAVVTPRRTAPTLDVNAPPLVGVGDTGQHLVAKVGVVVLRPGRGDLAEIVCGREAKAVFFPLVAKAHRAANVPHTQVRILFAEVVVEEACERLRRRGWRVLAMDLAARGEHKGAGGEDDGG